jgi:hypothetical protein
MSEREGCTTKKRNNLQVVPNGYSYCWVAYGWAKDQDELVEFITHLPSNEFDGFFWKYYRWGSPEARRMIAMGGLT